MTRAGFLDVRLVVRCSLAQTGRHSNLDSTAWRTSRLRDGRTGSAPFILGAPHSKRGPTSSGVLDPDT